MVTAVYSWPGSAVALLDGELLYTGHRSRHDASPPCLATSACRYRLYTYGCRRPSGVLGRYPSNLELTAGRSAGSGTEFRLLQATAEDDTF